MLVASHNETHCGATKKTVNTWNISGMFIVLPPITAKIRTRELATKLQTNQSSCLRFSFLNTDWLFSCETITFLKSFKFSQFSWSHCKSKPHEKRGNVSKEMDLFTTKRKLGLLVQKIFKINHSLRYVLKNVFIDLFLLTNIGFWRLTFPFTVFYNL